MLIFPYLYSIILEKMKKRGNIMYTVTEKKKIIDNKDCFVYGIQYNNVFYIQDISADRMIVEQLVHKYNKYNLQPIHLHDAIEDFLEDL